MSQPLQTSSVSAPGFFGLANIASNLLSCSCCKKEKHPHEFPKASNKARGYGTYCKQCKKEKLLKKRSAMSKDDWMLQNRRYWLKSQYNLSLDDYNNKLKDQNHRCAICQCDETEAFKGLLFVDHCHKTQKIRGLLCHHCNTALGKFKDSTEILKKAIAYLETHHV